jgi:hypothetical protein
VRAALDAVDQDVRCGNLSTRARRLGSTVVADGQRWRTEGTDLALRPIALQDR